MLNETLAQGTAGRLTGKRRATEQFKAMVNTLLSVIANKKHGAVISSFDKDSARLLLGGLELGVNSQAEANELSLAIRDVDAQAKLPSNVPVLLLDELLSGRFALAHESAPCPPRRPSSDVFQTLEQDPFEHRHSHYASASVASFWQHTRLHFDFDDAWTYAANEMPRALQPTSAAPQRLSMRAPLQASGRNRPSIESVEPVNPFMDPESWWNPNPAFGETTTMERAAPHVHGDTSYAINARDMEYLMPLLRELQIQATATTSLAWNSLSITAMTPQRVLRSGEVRGTSSSALSLGMAAAPRVPLRLMWHEPTPETTPASPVSETTPSDADAETPGMLSRLQPQPD